MIVYGNILGGHGLGAFAGGGRIIFGPFSFAESWSSDDFANAQQFNNWVKPYLDQVGRVGMTWDPPSPALLTNAEAKLGLWKNAADLGDPNANAYLAQITSQMNGLINKGDQLSLTGGNGHRSEAVEVQRYDTFTQIVNLIKQLSASSPPSGMTSTSVGATGTGLSASADSLLSTLTNLLTSPTRQSTSGPPAVPPSSLPQFASSTPGWIMPVAVGGGLLAFGGLLFATLHKKKAPALAGYRRRRHRR